MSMRMKGLTREQRSRLFDGQCPAIIGEGPCPYEPRKTYTLSSKLTLKVLDVRRRKQGGWALHYELVDRRDPVRNLRRTPAAQDFAAIRRGFDEYGYPPESTADTLQDAAEESSYTGAPTSLSDAGEAVDRRTQDAITKQAHENAGFQEAVNQARRERYELERRLERAREDARIGGIDISSPERVIERQIVKIEQRVYGGKRQNVA